MKPIQLTANIKTILLLLLCKSLLILINNIPGTQVKVHHLKKKRCLYTNWMFELAAVKRLENE